MDNRLTSNASDFDPLQYWNRRLSTRYSLGSTGWLSLGERFNGWSYAVRRRVFARLARPALAEKTSPRVLDVGSGTGFYLDLWRQLGVHDLVGSDLTPAAVERLAARFPAATIERLDIGAAPLLLAPESFDAISVMDVLYHIVDDDRYTRAMSNLAALLKPGGMLIFSENFSLEEMRAQHQVSRTKPQIEAALAGAGLVPVRTQPVFFLMNTPISSRNRMLHGWWSFASGLAQRREALGWCVGAVAFPVDVILGRVRRTGPSTTMIVCRRADELPRRTGPTHQSG